jgi:hypothetical protein
MMRNGSYSAWFRTQLGEGFGIIALNDGILSGGDSVSVYSGAYALDGQEFTASVAARRRTEGPSVFSIDNVDLRLTGRSTPNTASCTGTAEQAPGLTFEATLIRIVD